jgi:hypothetical protein
VAVTLEQNSGVPVGGPCEVDVTFLFESGSATELPVL